MKEEKITLTIKKDTRVKIDDLAKRRYPGKINAEQAIVRDAVAWIARQIGNPSCSMPAKIIFYSLLYDIVPINRLQGKLLGKLVDYYFEGIP
ncbi:MAG: hypothetical protein PHU54_08455 [Candidatus Omnitrophica bacterium]|jgi:hypothetical protein|nr:hypothetical protein [Candidatus Omnitrophota bacterium]